MIVGCTKESCDDKCAKTQEKGQCLHYEVCQCINPGIKGVV
jgi:hypothetical protein